MPMPVAEKDLTQHAGFECRDHPVLFGVQHETPELLTAEAKDPSFGLDQWLVYYSHVAKAAKKVVPEAGHIFLKLFNITWWKNMKKLYIIPHDMVCNDRAQHDHTVVYSARPNMWSFLGTRPFRRSSHLWGRWPSPYVPAFWGPCDYLVRRIRRPWVLCQILGTILVVPD